MILSGTGERIQLTPKEIWLGLLRAPRTSKPLRTAAGDCYRLSGDILLFRPAAIDDKRAGEMDVKREERK
jgi:hypothetical protein